MDGFEPVTLQHLSKIEVDTFVSCHERFCTPEFLLLKYRGVYRPGAEGKEDALFIVSTAKGARAAWHTEAVIIDFSELDYQWGDEMSWVYELGWDRVFRFSHPLVIIVGDRSAEAMKSLEPDSFAERCVIDLDSARKLARKQSVEYKQKVKDWKPDSK